MKMLFERFRRGVAVGAVAFGFLVALVGSAAVGADSSSESAAKISDYQVIRSLHKESVRWRSRYGLPAQELDEQCCQIAQSWANRMANDRWMRHGGGEQVIAQGYSSPQAAMQAWMASPGHRYWLLCSRGRCGFGCAKSKDGRWYWAGVFRSSSSNKAPEPTPAEEPQQQQITPVQNGVTCQNGVCRQRVRSSWFLFRR